MDSMDPRTPEETLGILLKKGMYQKFLEVAKCVNESIVAGAICTFAKAIIAENINPWEAYPKIQELKSEIVKEYPKDSLIRSGFNKAVKPFIERYNIASAMEELNNLRKTGNKKETRDGAIIALYRVSKIESLSEARREWKEYFASLDINLLPERVALAFEGLVDNYDRNGLAGAASAVAESDWSQTSKTSRENENFNP